MQNEYSDIKERDEIEGLFHYRIYPEQNLVVVKLLQNVTSSDIARWESVMMQEPLFKRDMDGVIDQREYVAYLNSDDVRELAEINRTQHKVNGRWIHLVNEIISTSLSYKYKKESSDIQKLEIFYTVERASEFLGYDLAPYLEA